MTARRLAFTLEALQSCCKDFEEHGAGVAIRVHGPGARTPHYLSLSYRAVAVVSDEPFVDPHRNYVRRVVKTCKVAKIPCFTVDGSTTVPPKSVLSISNKQTVEDDLAFTGAPAKAWIWERQTERFRRSQVYSAVRDGSLDAPDLQVKLPSSFFLDLDNHVTECSHNVSGSLAEVIMAVPSRWKDATIPCPGQRPWTVNELVSISDCKEWAMYCWEGADTTVPPCRQTHGCIKHASRRWNSFLNSRLQEYSKRRNQIIHPHSVSRISCYLNLGILSIFDVIYDVWTAKSSTSVSAVDCQNFLDEVVKWREGSYVHTFANPEYHSVNVLPDWSRRYLESLRTPSVSSFFHGKTPGYTYAQLESASTGDKMWDAMQGYLIDTGELHNNARMTWGKTAVHWQARHIATNEVLWQLICLNDRYALDGLSPPSYGGLLWCFGWGDKPVNGLMVSEKWAYQYRTGPEAFEQAKQRILYDDWQSLDISESDALPKTKRARSESLKSSPTKNPSQSSSILNFFAPVPKCDGGLNDQEILE